MFSVLQQPAPQTVDLERWNTDLSAATPEELLRWASARWGDRVALSCSFGGAAGMVLLDMVMQVAPSTTVLYVDTGLLFPATYRVVEAVRRRYGIDPLAARPRQSVTLQAEHEGAALWEQDPTRCCQLRKVEPLADALLPYAAWITGIRRDGAATRANAQTVEWSNKYGLVKLNPLAAWTERDVWRYIHANNVPYNPLLDQGYRSLGCYTCTRLPSGDDPRSGRWVGFNKTECGLHVETA